MNSKVARVSASYSGLLRINETCVMNVHKTALVLESFFGIGSGIRVFSVLHRRSKIVVIAKVASHSSRIDLLHPPGVMRTPGP